PGKRSGRNQYTQEVPAVPSFAVAQYIQKNRYSHEGVPDPLQGAHVGDRGRLLPTNSFHRFRREREDERMGCEYFCRNKRGESVRVSSDPGFPLSIPGRARAWSRLLTLPRQGPIRERAHDARPPRWCVPADSNADDLMSIPGCSRLEVRGAGARRWGLCQRANML